MELFDLRAFSSKCLEQSILLPIFFMAFRLLNIVHGCRYSLKTWPKLFAISGIKFVKKFSLIFSLSFDGIVTKSGLSNSRLQV